MAARRTLPAAIAELKKVSGEAKAILDVLRELAKDSKKVTQAQKSKITGLAKQLGKATSDAVKAQRDEEIAALKAAVKDLSNSLAIPGLPRSPRDSLRKMRVSKNARLARLSAKKATDFTGVLTKTHAEKLDKLVKAVKKDTAAKQFASAFLEGVVKIADLALTIAGKLAM